MVINLLRVSVLAGLGFLYNIYYSLQNCFFYSCFQMHLNRIESSVFYFFLFHFPLDLRLFLLFSCLLGAVILIIDWLIVLLFQWFKKHISLFINNLLTDAQPSMVGYCYIFYPRRLLCDVWDKATPE